MVVGDLHINLLFVGNRSMQLISKKILALFTFSVILEASGIVSYGQSTYFGVRSRMVQGLLGISICIPDNLVDTFDEPTSYDRKYHRRGKKPWNYYTWVKSCEVVATFNVNGYIFTKYLK